MKCFRVLSLVALLSLSSGAPVEEVSNESTQTYHTQHIHVMNINPIKCNDFSSFAERFVFVLQKKNN